MPEQDEADVSAGPIGAVSHMSLGTQVGSALSHQSDQFQSPSQSTGDKSALCLRVYQTKSTVEAYNQIRTELQLAQDPISGGEELAPLSDDDIAVFEQVVLKVGLENVPHLQFKKLTNAGVQGVVCVLQGVKIQLVTPEDDDSDTSEMDTSHASLPPDRSEEDPLALDHGDLEREKGELSERSSSPDTMDQDDILGRDTYLDGGLASDTGAAPERINGFQSKEMDTTAQPSGAESYSDRPMGSQDARDSDWGEGENETAKRHRLYPKLRPYMIPVPSGIDNGWYQAEDLMDTREVALPAHRVGRPNVDGSILGDRVSPLPPKRSGRQYYHNGRELRRQISYSRAEKDEKGKNPHITEQERLARAERQDTACKSDAYWKDQLAQYHYLPTPEHSPVNFSYRVRMTT